jgi:hypothetical protein
MAVLHGETKLGFSDWLKERDVKPNSFIVNSVLMTSQEYLDVSERKTPLQGGTSKAGGQ